ncbi:MAG: extracellular solute-binding protein [Patescibacteria group bacterium]|nr:extracellular solute-binding protein [Patescibacteria group bacterium]
MLTSALLTGVLVVLPLAGFGCRTVDAEALKRAQPLTLKYWRVFDDTDAIGPLLDDYQKLHPNVSIDYRKLRYDEYEKAILDAMAQDEGPDIISLHNTWLREWEPRLLPAPATVTMPFREQQGTIKKEIVTVLRTLPGPTVKSVTNDFVDVVASDVILPTEQDTPTAPLVPRVYGLPLSVDTLVVYYNRDLLNAAGVAQPAAGWREFQEQVKRLTKLDQVGNIIQSAAALGTADNIERSTDILALLMMQNGTPMTAEDGTATFDRYTSGTEGQPLPPGAVALTFYNDFANPEKEVYTWNAKMPGSLQAFVEGKVAYFFGYSYHLPMIRSLNPQLNFGLAPFPQIENNQPVNYANYWVETVSKNTKYPNEAWDLVQFITKAEETKKYLQTAKRPAALRSLLSSQLEDLDLSVFAAEVPTARSWYRGVDANAAETAFKELISQSLEGGADFKRLLELTAAKVNQTVK